MERRPYVRRTGFRPKAVVTGVLTAFAAIGFFGAGQTADPGVAVTWLRMGIGLSVTYLLYSVLLEPERTAASR